MDQHGEACWTLKVVYASMMDAGRPRGYVINMLFAHSSVELVKYVHGATPTSDFYDQQAENHSPHPNPNPNPHPNPKPTPHPNPNEPRRPAFLCSTCARVASPISPSMER